MNKKIHKILGVGLTLIMALSLTLAFSAPAMADEETWDRFTVPTESTAAAPGDYELSNLFEKVGPFARAIDGTFYIFVWADWDADFVNDLDEADLLSSDDGGRTWSATDFQADNFAAAATDFIVAIEPSSEDADVLYVATVTNVYKTTDAGATWSDLGDPTTGPATELITCLAVGYANGDPHVYVGTADLGADGIPNNADDLLLNGEVYYYQDAAFAQVWTDLNVCAPVGNVAGVAGVGAIDNSEVYGIATSPDFANDVLTVAVIYDDTLNASYVTANQGAGIGFTEWNDLEIEDDTAAAVVTIIEASDPVFVDDFDIDDNYELFVGVVGDAHATSTLGGVYRITGMAEGDDFLLDDCDDDIISLDLVGGMGGASILAGARITATLAAIVGPAAIWYSTDDGDNFDETDKAPTGFTDNVALDTVDNLVIVSDDFADSGEAWCASEVTTGVAGGREGAVSLTTDFGASWNQISLIDTDMAGAVYDIEFSPDYGTDDAPLFMVTEPAAVGAAAATDDSVWKFDGTNWERIRLDVANELNLVQTSPGYAADNTLFIAANAAPTMLRSGDGGATFTALVRNPGAAITSWLVIDDETVISGAAAGVTYTTTRYGRRAWDEPTMPGAAGTIVDIAMSPNYASDGTLLLGDAASQVFISQDEGGEFEEVSDSDIAADVTAVNDTYVAFDPRYADNMFIYAASDDTVERCEIDAAEDMGDQTFTDFAGAGTAPGLATGAANGASGIVVADDGTQGGEQVVTLYVADAAVANAGVWRSLNPADAIGDVVFENALAGLAVTEDFDSTVGAISNLEMTAGSNILYAIDIVPVVAIPGVIYTYEDTLAKPVVLTSPAVGEGIDSTTTVTLTWEDLNADTVNVYQVQVNEEDDFPGATDEVIGTTTVLGVALAAAATSDYTDGNEITWRAAGAGTEYFWRVRVGVGPAGGGPLLSRWSDSGSFMMRVAAPAAPVAVRPLPGEQDIVLTPAFSWAEIGGADLYEFEMATDADFTAIVDSATPANNVYLASAELDYATTYYWRVRGIAFSGAPEGDWNVSVFTTMLEPEEAAPPVVVEPTPPAPAAPDITLTVPAAETPAYVWAIIAIGAVLVVAMIVLIVRTRRTV